MRRPLSVFVLALALVGFGASATFAGCGGHLQSVEADSVTIASADSQQTTAPQTPAPESQSN